MLKHLQILIDSNTLSHFLIAAGTAVMIFAGLAGLRYFFSTHVRRIASQTATYWDDILVECISSTSTFVLFLLSFFLGILTLDMSSELYLILLHAAVVVFLYQLGVSLSRAISIWVDFRIRAQQESGEKPDNNNYAIISFILRLAVWVIVLLLALDNLGVNITTLVASLGIGGVAIALAVQNILGDLFASLSIAHDKPFLVGDFIVIDDLAGTVKNIGLKTTRVTSITGEELVFSNTDMLKSRIHNYRKMELRRIVYTLGVTFDTPAEKLRQIPEMIRDIFGQIPDVRLDRVHFSRIGQSGLDFEIVYYVNIADYNVYVRAEHAFNLAVIDRFARENIRFAMPVRTLHISRTE